jgi:hypothetical protein
MYDGAALRRFAMHAEELSQREKVFGGSISVKSIAEAMGIPPEDAYGLARYLHQIGWAEVSFSGDTPLTLTPRGYEEIARLRRPPWRQWIDLHPVAVNVFWMTATGIVAGIVAGLFVSYLRS